MLDTPSISAVVAAVGVLVGVTLAYLEVRTLVKQRQTDIVMRLYSTFGSKEFQKASNNVMSLEFKDFNDYRKKYSSDIEVSVSWSSVAAFFEGVGVLVKRKLVDISLVDDLFSTSILWTWKKMGSLVKEGREYYKRPQIWEWFEYLYNELQKREQRLQQTQQ